MARYTVSAVIEANTFVGALRIASQLPRDFSPETLSMYGSSLRSFSIYEDETGRELSINVYEKENNEQ